ncbi:MAG: hypothetical protein IRY85_10535 [Micromonosporaceae bacterium]|nr:hypothetical protein [Micromonosporaceae bacterium]
MTKTGALLTWDGVARAIEKLPENQRAVAAEIIEKERGRTGAEVEISDGPWYIERARVSGYIGIGEQPVSVTFGATPGLTIVTARNGTGKSSLVHGVRLALSNGGAAPANVVEENLHWGQRAITVRITNGTRTVDLVCDDSGVRWSEKGAGEDAVPPSWVEAFERYLPVLLYSELSPVIDKPSDLHKFLKQALSLSVLERLLKASDEIKKDKTAAERELVEPRSRMERSLAATGDETLSREVLAAGDVPSEAAAARLRALIADLSDAAPAMPPIPPLWTVDRDDVERITQAVAKLDAARAQVVSGADTIQDVLDRLLAASGAYVADLRDRDTCPVCGTPGVAWADRARRESERLRELLAAVHEAKAPVVEAVERLRGYAPPSLSPAAAEALRGLHEPGTEEHIEQWHRLRAATERLHADTLTAETVREFMSESAELAAWYEGMAKAVQARYDSAIAGRATVGADIRAWLDAVDRVRARIARGAAAAKLSNTVERWIRETRDVVFHPIRDKVVQIWRDLNADTDLTLTNVALAGGVRQAQKVTYELAVDGTPVRGGSGRAEVLSTGQRNALSLAAYLPRATQENSPFGFLILDDPIHAFDSFRVNYLAQELIRLAERYQVIVFTHDDRLWREVRALDYTPRHIRLRRLPGQRSHVKVEAARWPGEPLLKELENVLTGEKWESVGTADARVTMTLALCRQAVDTAVTTLIEILGRRHGRGQDEIESALGGIRKTRDQLDLLGRWAAEARLPALDLGRFQSTISALNDAAHGNAPGTVEQCRRWMRNTRDLVEYLYQSVERS